jgi:hypothetical protein
LRRPPGKIGVAGGDGDLYPVRRAELGHDPGHVRLDRGLAHVEAGGDLGVGATLGYLGGDLALALGEPAHRLLGGRAPGRGRVGAEAFDERAGDRRRQHGLACGHQAHRPDDRSAPNTASVLPAERGGEHEVAAVIRSVRERAARQGDPLRQAQQAEARPGQWQFGRRRLGPRWSDC